MRRCAIIWAALLAVSVSGCATHKAWVYMASRSRDVAPLSDKKAVVLPFDDMRPNVNTNLIFLYMIPLMPVGWVEYNVPEGQAVHVTSGLWTNYKPTEDYAKALAAELQNARVFREAYFDFRRADADFVISGKILTTRYKGFLISYGLSFYGPLLWLFGLPSGTVSNELSIELTVIDAKSNNTIFIKPYTAPVYDRVSWIYVQPNDFNYPDMLKGLYTAFLEDLKAQAASIARLTGSVSAAALALNVHERTAATATSAPRGRRGDLLGAEQSMSQAIEPVHALMAE